MISVTVNGDSKSFEHEVSLRDLLSALDLPNERIAIELNKNVIRKKDWENISISNDDELEIIHFVGGG